MAAEPEPEPFWVWPENWPAFCVFSALQTQWRIVSGMGGRRYTGLEYASIPAVFAAHGIKKKKRSEIFDAIRVMEIAALNEINRHGK